MDKKPNYTVIIHTIRIDLGLSCNEYCLADIIYHLSNNPNSAVKGWCYAGKDTIANYLGITERSVFNIINKLVEQKILEKDEATKHLRTSQLWYDKVIINSINEKSAVSMKKVQSEYEKSSVNRYEKSSYNSNSSNKNINNDDAFKKTYPQTTTNYPLGDYRNTSTYKEQAKEFANKFGAGIKPLYK